MFSEPFMGSLVLRSHHTLRIHRHTRALISSSLAGCIRYLSNSTALEKFRIVEVGPRDGLQNEKAVLPTETKLKLIGRLAECGFPVVEATSFVSPKWIPQMYDQEQVATGLRRHSNNTHFSVLVPNLEGLERLIALQEREKHNEVDEIAVFTAASESFTRKNTNCSVEESLERASHVVTEALKSGFQRVRGYVSTVIGCPYEGAIQPSVVAQLTATLLSYGCYEVSLGDTTGVGAAGSVNALLDEVLRAAPVDRLAVHFHDTYGQALSNVLTAIDRGVRVADSSVAGLGGCPYAKGATGNLASEDLVYMLQNLGFETGIDLNKLVSTSEWICGKMARANASKVATAVLARKKRS